MTMKVTVFGNDGNILQVIDIKTGSREMDILRMILIMNDIHHYDIEIS